MLTDQLYTICVRQEHGYCGIEWMQDATNSPDSFELDATDNDGLAVSDGNHYFFSKKGN